MNNSLKHKAGGAVRYARFLLNSSTRYSVHSPFIFRLINEILRNKTEIPETKQVEKLRRELLSDHEIIEKIDFGAGSIYPKSEKYPVKISQIARRSSGSRKQASRLFRLVRFSGALNILELGTSLGLTSAYLSLAAPGGRVVTIEGCPALAEIARKNFRNMDLANIDVVEGRFEKVLPEVLVSFSQLDFVFFDGHHTKEATLKNYHQCLPLIHNESVFVFDDIHWSSGMEEAWHVIREGEPVRSSIDLFGMGWIFFRKELSVQHFILRY